MATNQKRDVRQKRDIQWGKVKVRVSPRLKGSFIDPVVWINYDEDRGLQINEQKAILDGPSALDLALSHYDHGGDYWDLHSRRSIIFSLGDGEVRSGVKNEVVDFKRQGNIQAVINGSRRLAEEPFFNITGMAYSYVRDFYFEFSGTYHVRTRRGTLIFRRHPFSVLEVNVSTIGC